MVVGLAAPLSHTPHPGAMCYTFLGSYGVVAGPGFLLVFHYMPPNCKGTVVGGAELHYSSKPRGIDAVDAVEVLHKWAAGAVHHNPSVVSIGGAYHRRTGQRSYMQIAVVVAGLHCHTQVAADYSMSQRPSYFQHYVRVAVTVRRVMALQIDKRSAAPDLYIYLAVCRSANTHIGYSAIAYFISRSPPRRKHKEKDTWPMADLSNMSPVFPVNPPCPCCWS